MIKKILFPAIGIAAITLSSCGGGSQGDEYEHIDMLAVQTERNGSWSFYRPDGTLQYADEFKNQPSCVVEGYFSVQEGEGYTLYKVGDKKPEIVKGCEELIGVGTMNDGLIPVVAKNERIRVINGQGETKFTLMPIDGREVVSVDPSFRDGLLKVYVEGDKYGYVDTNGKTVIAPKYDSAWTFSDGRAVVGEKTDSTSGQYNYTVIDKSGKEVFKVKKGSELWGYSFLQGYLSVITESGRAMLYDRDGKEMTFPAKVQYISAIEGKVAVYSSEDGLGLITLDGEELTRPKYSWFSTGPDGTFIVGKDSKEAIILDSKGEEKGEFDYAPVSWMGKFGYQAIDGRNYLFIKDDGKLVSKDSEFADVSTGEWNGKLESQYFDIGGVAAKMADMVGADGAGKYKIGAEPSSMLTDPQKYTYVSGVYPAELQTAGLNYDINTVLNFDGSIATSVWSMGSGTTYEWRDVTLQTIAITVQRHVKVTPDEVNAIIKAFQKKGFKKIDGVDQGDKVGAIMEKGGLRVLVAGGDANSAGVLLYSAGNLMVHNSVMDVINSTKQAKE